MEFVDKDGRIFMHHELWECWRNDLYKNRKPDNEKIEKSKIILQSVELCDFHFSRVVSCWPNSSKVHLSNKTINRQAWLGHASFCISHGANENEGIMAWHLITENEQHRANAIADFYILKFEKENGLNAEKIPRNGRFNRCTRTGELDF